MLRIIKLIIYYIAYQMGSSAVIVGIWMLFNGFHFPDSTSSIGLILNTYAMIIGTLGFSIHLFLGGYCHADRSMFGPVKGRILFLSSVLLLSMGCWNNYLIESFRIPDHLEQVFEFMMNRPEGVFSIVILAPVFEEIFFRGAIQGYLTRVWKNPWYGIVTASVLFGTIHGNPAQIPFATITGMALGWVYYRTGSLLPSILMHFINNGSSVLLYHLTKNHTDSTITGMLGTEGALILAGAGVILTLICLIYMHKHLPKRAQTAPYEYPQ